MDLSVVRGRLRAGLRALDEGLHAKGPLERSHLLAVARRCLQSVLAAGKALVARPHTTEEFTNLVTLESRAIEGFTRANGAALDDHQPSRGASQTAPLVGDTDGAAGIASPPSRPQEDLTATQSGRAWHLERASVHKKGASRPRSNKYTASDNDERPGPGERRRVWVGAYRRADGALVHGHYRTIA